MRHLKRDMLGQTRPHLLALEPRMMFDAAAVATTDAVVHQVTDTGERAQFQRAFEVDGADRTHAPAETPAETDARTAAEPREAAPPEAGSTREIIFIDTAVADYKTLAERWSSRGEVVLIDSSRDGIDQMRAALAGRSDVGAIHIVSHGATGVFFLGTTRVDSQAIAGELAGSLAAIGRSLSADGDILIYGCDFAAGSAGADALQRFAAATGADVAATNDTTGAAPRGDWDLERHDGTVEARALDGGDWAHTLDPNVIVPISVTANSLTVTAADGTVLVSPATGDTGYTAGAGGAQRTADVGVGATARWANAATLPDGRAVDLKATIVSLSTGDGVQFNRPGIGANGDDPTFLLRDLQIASTGNGNGASVEIRWELVLAGTDQALPANVQFTIEDIDGVGGRPNSRETVSASTAGLAYYTRERQSNIAFTSALDRITASGTQNENTDTSQPVSPQSAATFDWSAVSQWTLTYTLAANNGVTTNAQFFHDGDADFVYTDPVYVSVPRLDLDGNDDTAAGNDAHFTFTENGAAVRIVDADVVVVNPMPANGITGGTVVLTNAQAGDTFLIGTLPSNITAVVGGGASGTITVTLTGNGSEDDYAQAFRAITFRNTSENPSTVQRVIDVSFSNDTLTSAVATSRIDVVAVNDAPTARDDTVSTNEDTAVTFNPRANDTDPDGDPLTITAATADNGTVTRNANGTLTYRPNADFNGRDVIRYTISDGKGGTSSAFVDVTVQPVNDAPRPVGTLPAQSAADRDTVRYPTAGGFTDVEGDTLTYSATGLPTGLTIDSATGEITGTIDRSASQANGGVYDVVVTARDPAGATGTQAFRLTVTNPAPTANPDTASTNEDVPVTLDVRTNDSDPDGDPLTVTAATAANGTVTINGDGTITYTPNAHYNGTDTITYTVSDGEGGTASSTVAVTIAAVDDAPVIAQPLPPQTGQDAASVRFETAQGFTDPEGDTLSYSATGLPAGLVIDAATGVVSGTLGRSASQANGGRYTVTVTADDGRGGQTSQTFTFTAENPPPVAGDDAVSTTEETPVTFAVLGNDSDPDGDLPLRVVAATAGRGTVVVNGDGTLTYTPGADVSGTDTITYTIEDADGGRDEGTVTVTIADVQDPPVATNDTANVAEDGQVTIPVLANDRDPDGDPLTVVAATADNGTVTINPDGTLAYRPNANFNGADQIRYTIDDGRGGRASATVAVQVAPQRDAPDAAVPPAQSVAEDAALVFSAADGNAITVTNVDGGDLTVTIVATRGTLTLSRTDGLTFTAGDGSTDTTMTFTGSVAAINAALDGARFVGAADMSGPADLSITTTRAPVESEDFQDGGAEEPRIPANNFRYVDQSMVPGWSTTEPDGIIEIWSSGYEGVTAREGDQFFEINAEEPATLFQQFRSTAGSPIAVAFSHRARMGDDTMRLTATDLGADGVFGTADDVVLFTQDYTTGNAAWADYSAAITGAATGNLIQLDFTAVDQASSNVFEGNFLDAVSVTQNGAPLSTTRTVDITVTPVADAAADRATTPEDMGVTIDVLANDRFADPARAITAVNGTAVIAGGAAVAVANGTVALDNAGRLVFTPTANYNGTTDFTYSVAAGGSTETATVTVDVAPGNDAPQAQPIARDYALDEGAAVDLPFGDGFRDPDGDRLTYVATGLPAGLSIDPATGRVTGTPDRSASQVDGGRYPVTITATDPAGATATQDVTLTLSNPAPVARDDRAATAEDVPVTLRPLANDVDPDGDPLTIVAAAAGNGTVAVNPDGSLTYTPAADWNGTDTITYTVSDGQGGTSTATITVEVGGVNDAPVARPLPSATADDAQAIRLDLGGFFSDGDGDPLAFTATGLPPGLSIDPVTGVIAGTVDRSASAGGPYRVVVTATDPGGLSASSGFDWVIVNPAPRAADDAATVAEDASVVIDVLANDRDPDGDPLRVVAAEASSGRVAIGADGRLTYTPAPDFSGDVVIRYTVDDGDGGRATASVLVTVTPTADAPVLVAPVAAQDAPERAPVSIDAGAAFRDADGDPLTFAATGLPPGLSIDPATGRITGAATPGSAIAVPGGRYPVTVTATDPTGRQAQASFVLTVTDLPPVAVVPTVVVSDAAEGAAVTIDAGAQFRDPEGGPLTFTAANLPAGLSIDPATGRITGTPARGAAAAAPDGVYRTIVTATDANGNAATATVEFRVVNRPPVALNDVTLTREDEAVRIDVLGNDRDPGGDPLTITAASAGSGTVTINADGTLTYVPGPDFAGTDRIRYTISDGQGGTAEAIVEVTVTPVNDAPVVPGRDPLDAVAGRPLVIDGLAGIRDADGDPLTIVSASSANGTVAIGPDGRLIFTPTLGFNGTATITYTVVDGQGGTATATLVVRVAQEAAADICQLLEIGRVRFPNVPAFVALGSATGEFANPMVVGAAVDAVRSLNGTAIGPRAVEGAVNAARWLRGTGIDAEAIVAGDVARLHALTDFRDAGDRLFDHRWGDFVAAPLSGFSAAADQNACVMVESVVRGGAIYLEVRDIAADGRSPIRSVEVIPASGGARPEWLKVDPRGLAIIERGADMDELHLKVRVVREDGRVTVTPIVVQGATGEIELDRVHHRTGPPLPSAPLHATVQTPEQTAAAEAARIQQSFQ